MRLAVFSARAGQGELAINYLARLRGVSACCNFIVKCTSCGLTTSYVEKIFSHQLIRELADSDIQEKILFKAADNETELTLQDITNSVEALEVAKSDQATLTGRHGNLNRQGPTKEMRTNTGLSFCNKCGSTSHRARDTSCRAINMICRGYQGKGHMIAFCPTMSRSPRMSKEVPRSHISPPRSGSQNQARARGPSSRIRRTPRGLPQGRELP